MRKEFFIGALVLVSVSGCTPKDPLTEAAPPPAQNAVAAPPPTSSKQSALPASLQPSLGAGGPAAAPR